MNLALKIDVDTYRGTRDGVPHLVDLLKKYEAGATFLFSLGPDHTGRAIKRVFRKGFLRKVRRTRGSLWREILPVQNKRAPRYCDAPLLHWSGSPSIHGALP